MGDVVDRADEERFVIEEDGHTSELVYHLNGSRFVLIHTEVPDELAGRGIGGRLVRAALDRARREDLTVVPKCPFARSWLEQHPDATDGVTIDWR
ncbi:MAG TPA: GNAT family N-acetyltransferase [Acidimicrobiales bacterium]|nr:GNAT family N-acetyltransferase [Acidimicrobiales bacterium]